MCALTDSTLPTIDPATGKFSGPFPAANAQVLGFLGDLAANIFSEGGQVAATLIGVGLGDARDAVPASYTFETRGFPGTDTVSLAIDPGTAVGDVSGSTTPFPATIADPALAAKFGAPAGPIVIAGQITMTDPNYQRKTGWGRGCVADGGLGAGVVNCTYNGERWFAGDNETANDPNFGSASDGSGTVPGTNLNNAGALPGVATIFAPHSYLNIEAGWRAMEASLGGAARAGDFKVYWGNPGKVDSVIDVAHNVPVPFIPDSMGAGFGILNAVRQQRGRVERRPSDGRQHQRPGLRRALAVGRGRDRRQRRLGRVRFGRSVLLQRQCRAEPGGDLYGALTGAATVPPRPNPGFLIYIAGRVSMIELSAGTLPTQTVWTLRSYIGFVTGGNGAGGSIGPYAYTPAIRPLTALGAELRIDYAVTNRSGRPPRKISARCTRCRIRTTSPTRSRPRPPTRSSVREPARAGDHPDLLVERRAGPGLGAQLHEPVRPTGARRWPGDLERAEPQQPGGRERRVLLPHRGRRCTQGRSVYRGELRAVVHAWGGRQMLPPLLQEIGHYESCFHVWPGSYRLAGSGAGRTRCARHGYQPRQHAVRHDVGGVPALRSRGARRGARRCLRRRSPPTSARCTTTPVARHSCLARAPWSAPTTTSPRPTTAGAASPSPSPAAPGRFGLQVGTFGFDNQPVYTVDQPDGTGAVYSVSQTFAGATFAQNFSDRFSAGFTAKFVFDQLGEVNGTAFAVDFGTSFHAMLNNHPIKLAFVVANLGTDLKYSGDALAG